ncbi:MAG: DUF5343 domain-containing protein [Armatimonadetes bacterium]|nr:DUF5343 domain-containing protein [Armatimonadota bacterium]
MANKYPYVASAGPLVKTVSHLRKSFPKEVTADTLRKLGVAPKNESYVINVLRFLGVIDEEGKKVEDKAHAFVQHQDDSFQVEFGQLVEEAYEELFELHSTLAWTLDRSDLTQFFRTTDRSSEVVGTRQAATFAALAALSGYIDLPIAKSTNSTRAPKAAKKTNDSSPSRQTKKEPLKPSNQDANQNDEEAKVGLTVRIEVNLPATGDQDTYDRIFQSIRKNLLNGS